MSRDGKAAKPRAFPGGGRIHGPTMSISREFLWSIIGLLASIMTCGCGSGRKSCIPGEQVECTCSGQNSMKSLQTCNADGSAFGECSGCDESASNSTGGQVDPCAGKLIFAGFATIGVPWEYLGATGTEAGIKSCKALAADNVCDYEQLKEIFADPGAHPGDIDTLLSLVQAGIPKTAWVNRTTSELVGGIVSMPGPGGRCNDWTDATASYDGEFITISNDGGSISGKFSLDADTLTAGPGLDCSSQHDIPCCYPPCK